MLRLTLLILAALTFNPLMAIVVGPVQPINKVTGHFMNRGRRDAVYMVPPIVNKAGTGCAGGCVAVLKFSDRNVPMIKLKDCIGGTPVNLGDLDGDGLDEIGILREWFTSCWRDYDVYTFKNGKWQMAVPPIRTHCNQWDKNLKPVVKDPRRKGYVRITFSEFVHNEVVIKVKSIAIL